MSKSDSALTLMRELGPLFAPEQIIYYPQHASWQVVVDADIQIDISHDAEHEQFVFLLDLGPIPAERQHKVYELLLRFSYLWRDSGGLHMAMNDAGNAVLMFKYPLLGLNVTRLHTLLGNLLNHARRWRELIQHPPQTDEDETERPTAVDLPPFGGIRV